MLTDLVAHRVPYDSSQNNQDHHQTQLHVSAAGNDTAQPGSRLAREDKGLRTARPRQRRDTHDHIRQEGRDAQNALNNCVTKVLLSVPRKREPAQQVSVNGGSPSGPPSA